MKKKRIARDSKSFNRRPSWDEYFLSVTREVAKRATCDRGRSGCVIVKDKRILATGYVGSPIGISHCDDIGHMLRDVISPDGAVSKHCVRTIHAEQNAICQAARCGISLEGATIYCTMEPCFVCAKMMVNCGIKRVTCEKKYHAAGQTRELFKQAKVKLDVMSDEVLKYKDQK